MTTPPGIKDLWKNVVWKNDVEKKAFYHKYFKKHKFVLKDIEESINSMKEKILGFIEDNPKIKEKDKERPLNINDIKEYIGGL